MKKQEAIRALDQRVSRLEALIGTDIRITAPLPAGETAPVDSGKVVQVPEMVSPKVAEFIQAKDAEIARLKFLLDTQASDYKARCATFQLVEEDRDRLVTESNDAAKTVKMLKADIDTRNELINERYALINQQRDEIAQLTDELHARNDEIVGLRAEVERWKSVADAHEQNYNMMLKRIDEVAAERDALQAHFDGGVRVWGGDYGGIARVYSMENSEPDTHTALLIDERLIDAQPIADAQEMVEETAHDQ